MKYYLHAEVFTAVEYSYSEQLKNMKSETIGLTHTQAQQHFDTFGQGHMEFEKTTFCQLVYIEVTKPFFLFVVFCFIQMCLTGIRFFKFRLCCFWVLCAGFLDNRNDHDSLRVHDLRKITLGKDFSSKRSSCLPK